MFGTTRSKDSENLEPNIQNIPTTPSNHSVCLESSCLGTEEIEDKTYVLRDELSFSKVVVGVSCQKPIV